MEEVLCGRPFCKRTGGHGRKLEVVQVRAEALVGNGSGNNVWETNRKKLKDVFLRENVGRSEMNGWQIAYKIKIMGLSWAKLIHLAK